MAEASDVPGASVDDVILEVKQAISLAGRLDTQAGVGTQVRQVDLTLKAFTELSGGAKFEFKIPIIDQKVTLGSKLDRQETQTVAMSFTPVQAARDTESGTIKSKLVDALIAIRHSMGAAAAGEVPLGLKEASVTLEFVLEAGGEISLIIDSAVKSKWANTIKLTVGPKP